MALDTPSSPFSFISTRSLSHENDHSILSVPVEQFTAQVESWAGEFEGDYEIQIFGERVTVLTSVEDIRQVLALRPSKFVRHLTPVSLRRILYVCPCTHVACGVEFLLDWSYIPPRGSDNYDVILLVLVAGRNNSSYRTLCFLQREIAA